MVVCVCDVVGWWLPGLDVTPGYVFLTNAWVIATSHRQGASVALPPLATSRHETRSRLVDNMAEITVGHVTHSGRLSDGEIQMVALVRASPGTWRFPPLNPPLWPLSALETPLPLSPSPERLADVWPTTEQPSPDWPWLQWVGLHAGNVLLPVVWFPVSDVLRFLYWPRRGCRSGVDPGLTWPRHDHYLWHPVLKSGQYIE